MVEGHPLMTWPDAFSFGQDDSDCSTAPPVGWSYLLVPKLSSVGGLVYLKGWRRRKSKSLVYERQPTRFNHKQTGFHNHKLPGGSRCGTEFLKPKSNADLDSIAVSLFGWSKQIQFKSSPNRDSIRRQDPNTYSDTEMRALSTLTLKGGVTYAVSWVHFAKIHVGKIHFVNGNLKAVGPGFQKTYDIA